MKQVVETFWQGAVTGHTEGTQATTKRLWRRVAGWFALLCLLKLGLLAGLSSHLYLTHWRVNNHIPTLADWVNFHLFCALVLGSLVLTGRSVPSSDARTLRGLNAGAFGVGLLFIVLTFRRMRHNYLYPVMTGVLNWEDVWSYLKLDLFFEPPYLALYLGGYGLAYWVLARTRREQWALPFLGALAVLYLELNLRSLVVCGPELLVVNCLGLASWLSWRFQPGPLSLKWQAWPVGLAAAGWLLLATQDRELLHPGPCAVVLMALTAALWASAMVLMRRTPAYGTLSHFLPFWFMAFFLFTNRHHPLADNFNHLVVYGLSLAHYFWQEAVLAALGLVVLMGCQRILPRASVALIDLGALALAVAGMADVMLARNMGFRLDWQALVVCNDPLLLWRTVKPYAAVFAAGLLGLAGAYAGMLWLARRCWPARTAEARESRTHQPWFALACTILSAAAAPWLVFPDKAEGTTLVQVLKTSPIVTGWRTPRLPSGELDHVARVLGAGHASENRRPTRVLAPSPRDLNVLLVVMESSANRYLSLFGAKDETQPRLKKYRDRMELFPNFYCNFVNSLNARFSVVSGLYPCKPYVTYVTPRVEAPALFDILHTHGWAVSLFDSCHRDYQRWGDYLAHHHLDVFHDARTMPGKERFPQVSWGVLETATLTAITNQFALHARRNERFFLTYLPVAPHMPFDSPAREFEQFDNGVGVLNNNYTGRYKNQLLYMDWIITRLLDALEQWKLLDRTLVVLTADHGEMVGEDDPRLGHGWNLEPWLANVPLIIMDPHRRGCRTNCTLGSQVDLLPTILDLLQVPLPEGEIYQGVSLYDERAAKDRTVYVMSHRPRALIRGSHYFLEDPELATADAPRTPVHIYEIRHEGVRTEFRRLGHDASIRAELDRFERFQKSFLVHYAHYRDLARARQNEARDATLARTRTPTAQN